MKKIIIISILLGIQNVYAQVNPLFLGGSGDGFNTSSYLQANANLTMYNGNIGDGYAKNNYAPSIPQTLYNGGGGDGWASNVIPMGPLPIELMSFTGKELNSKHLLDWTTSLEINSSHFVIEHSSTANNFSELGMRDAAGNSSEKQNYSFTNIHPVIGNNYYRLKMVDIDGKSKYSNIILLKQLNDRTSLIVYPNPTANMLNVDMQGIANATRLNIEIIDGNGKIVLTQQVNYQQQSFAMNVSNFANGLYFLKLKYNTNSEVVKFSINK